LPAKSSTASSRSRRSPDSRPSDARREASEKQEGRARIGAALRHPLAITAAGALVASLLIPAFTKQWQDRQEERELKTELAAEMDERTTRTVIASRILIDRRFREAQATDARRDELQEAAGASRKPAARALVLALETERDAGAAAHIELFADWLVTRSVVRSRLAAYYPDDNLAQEWERYADHVTLYLRFGSSASNREFKERYVRILAAFLGQNPDEWLVLANDPRSLASDGYAAYVRADALLSDRLLREKNELLRRVLDSDIEGFSTDTGDLLTDLVPFYD